MIHSTQKQQQHPRGEEFAYDIFLKSIFAIDEPFNVETVPTIAIPISDASCRVVLKKAVVLPAFFWVATLKASLFAGAIKKANAIP